MKQRNRRCQESLLTDPDFAEALSSSESNGRSNDRQAQRKAWQLCRQVQRAINLALSDCNAATDLDSLFVEEVSPAPDCGRLLVHVIIPEGRSVADILSILRQDTARLRSEVAMAITRKRSPELCFVPAYRGGGANE